MRLGNPLKVKKFWQDNHFIFREFKHFPAIAVLAVILSCLAVAFEGVNIGFLLFFLQNLTNPAAKPIHTGITWFDIWILGVNAPATERMFRIASLIVLSTWLRSGFTYLSQIYTELTQLSLIDRFRKAAFEQIQSLSLSYFSATKSGDIVNSIAGEVTRVSQIFQGVAYLFTRFLNIFIYLLSMFVISWQLSLLSIGLFSLLVMGLSRFNAIVREQSFALPTANNRFTTIVIELINGIRTVQAFATQDFERKRYYAASEEILKANKKLLSGSLLVKPLSEGLSMMILVGLILFAFSGADNGLSMSTGALLTFFFVLVRLVPNIQDLNSTTSRISSLKGSMVNVKNLLSTEGKQYFRNGKLEFPGLTSSIYIESVDFGYSAEKMVLQDITLTLEKGKMTALVGGSGAGKTTLVDLVTRFYDPVCGAIFVNGTDLREFEIRSLRRRMAIVSQDTFIFNTSVLNNIAYGSENKTEEEIREASRLANALDFIDEMPEGFETLLGDRGVRLSGGQRQRIAIARALLRNPEILILDEATSALDSVSERLIQESLEKLAVGRTVIAIAHRLSTIVRADKVVVLEQGRIVEQGTYQNLLEKKGKLWEYHTAQTEEIRGGVSKLLKRNQKFDE
ncbi:Heterocyst differentiation ATP-binding protein HepA [Tumidithrix helvetica PCC 7403]|uniref:heterocyst formation ABC transporter subunit HepA n=1 Tax=Tumidithrix helvetica TaxID=3457545 RepID=UPI003CAAF80E